MNRERAYAYSLSLAVSTTLFAALCLAPGVSFSQSPFPGDQPSDMSAEEESSGTPIMMEAEHLDYDQQSEVVTARGKVEVVQGDRVLLADELIYDQRSGKVYARGNTSMLEPEGNVYFSDQMELTNDMKRGVIQHFSARLADGSLFAARQAERLDEHTIELTQAVYSPCKVNCAPKGQGESPLWQVKSDHVVIDQLKQKAVYDDTTIEVYGLPVFYTPYFSHALPGADNKSGFLMPEYRFSNNVGTMVRVPYYYAIAKDRDATFIPIITTEEGLVMAGEYRQKYDNGQMMFDGSITRPRERDPAGNAASGQQVRGNINAVGEFNVRESSGWGFDVHRVTDDTYLRRYDFAQDTLLTSRLHGYTSDFSGEGSRSFARVQSLAFQGLTAQDNRRTIPVALPLADFNYESAPGAYNSRFTVDGNLMLLHRDLGAESRRLSSRLGWKLPYISDDGQVIEFATHLRADIYDVSDVALSDGRNFDGTTGRMVPDASVTWRYPFVNRVDEETSLMLEPVVSFVASPGGGNPEKIPNEDSLVPEFTEGNLFSDGRYAGFDRVETGPRMSYGLRGQAQIFSDKFVDWLIGQHFRMNDDRTFPYSNDLESHLSDYVGKVGLTYQPFGIAYRFRLDRDKLSPKRSEIDGSFNHEWLSLNVSYLSLTNDPVLATKEVISGGGSVRLTEHWTLSAGAQRDLELDFTNSTYAGLVFQNECTNISTQIGRSYTRDRDIEPSTDILFRISLKNLE